MFQGYVNSSGSTQQVEEEFSKQGIFLVKITPMRASLVLLEDGEDGETKDLIEDEREWIESWFDKIKECIPTKVSNESETFSNLHGNDIYV